jgi:hypothetical protein
VRDKYIGRVPSIAKLFDASHVGEKTVAQLLVDATKKIS